MISEDDFAAAAEGDPALAFVRLERQFRQVLEKKLEETESNGAYDAYVFEYMNHTIAAAKALELGLFSEWELPHVTAKNLHSEFSKFKSEIDHYVVQIQITHFRQKSNLTIGLADTEKRIIRHYVDQIKQLLDESSLDIAKRERLQDRLNGFLKELDRDRTPLRIFSDVVISLAQTGGQAATELEPAWKWVKLIGKILGDCQDSEQLNLPRPIDIKKLEGPKRKPPPPAKPKHDEMDDEIPF